MPRERELVLAPKTREAVRGLHPTAKRKVRMAIEAIRADPGVGDELTRELTGLRRLRVGRLRIVYRATAHLIEIVAIGPRATIYVDLSARERNSW